MWHDNHKIMQTRLEIKDKQYLKVEPNLSLKFNVDQLCVVL